MAGVFLQKCIIRTVRYFFNSNIEVALSALLVSAQVWPLIDVQYSMFFLLKRHTVVRAVEILTMCLEYVVVYNF